LVKRTISIDPFVDLIFKEAWQSGIKIGWPRPSYSLAVEASVMTAYYDIVVPHRLPRKEALDATWMFLIRKAKKKREKLLAPLFTEKDEQMLRDYIKYLSEAREREIAAHRREAGDFKPKVS